MKKRLAVIAILVLTALTATTAHAEKHSVTLLLVGGSGQDVLVVSLSPDGRNYLIDSLFTPLEAGGEVCFEPEESHHQLICEATAIAGFEVNGGKGNDQVTISPKILVPTTLRGGEGVDRLRGGFGADKLVGGADADFLYGHHGEDWLFGGDGEDWLYGGPNEDRLVGGPNPDQMNGGPGKDTIVTDPDDYPKPGSS
jgi:Ca2+-binding RTX toxin-like protein